MSERERERERERGGGGLLSALSISDKAYTVKQPKEQTDTLMWRNLHTAAILQAKGKNISHWHEVLTD